MQHYSNMKCTDGKTNCSLIINNNNDRIVHMGFRKQFRVAYMCRLVVSVERCSFYVPTQLTVLFSKLYWLTYLASIASCTDERQVARGKKEGGCERKMQKK